MSGLSRETIKALCNECDSNRTRNSRAAVTADIKCDGTEMVRVDFLDEKDEIVGSRVTFEKPPKFEKRLRR